jgi:uncharacterized protein YgbK (DUF1537 family)
MRALHRTVAAVALGLPLMLAGSAMANASAMDHRPDHHRMHHLNIRIHVDPEGSQSAREKNTTRPVIVSGSHNTVTIEQANETNQSLSQDAFTR